MTHSGRTPPPPAGAALPERRVALISTTWGLAEATLFFLVPDVYLSRVALRSLRQGLRACLWALLGALLGGTLMYAWGLTAPEAAEAALVEVPAVSARDVAWVREELEEHGWGALFLGPLTGTPYKIYAVEAARLGRGLVPLLAISVPARLLRFVLVTLLAAGLGAAPGLRNRSPRTRNLVHAAAWTLFYALFFTLKGG